MTDGKTLVRKQIEHALKQYLSDLAAMDHPTLEDSPGGAARAPYDFTYEVVIVNEMIAAELRGDRPDPWPSEDGWAVAPADFRTPEVARARVESSTRAVLETLEARTPDELDEPTTPGQPTTRLASASLCAVHLTYHDAQLNYVQSLRGDAEVHWNS